MGFLLFLDRPLCEITVYRIVLLSVIGETVPFPAAVQRSRVLVELVGRWLHHDYLHDAEALGRAGLGCGSLVLCREKLLLVHVRRGGNGLWLRCRLVGAIRLGIFLLR